MYMYLLYFPMTLCLQIEFFYRLHPYLGRGCCCMAPPFASPWLYNAYKSNKFQSTIRLFLTTLIFDQISGIPFQDPKTLPGFSLSISRSQMGRKPIDSEPTRWAPLALLLMCLLSCTVVYMFASTVLRPTNESLEMVGGQGGDNEGLERESGECCRGIDNLELWGAAVKWGSQFKFNSSEECCRACKAMCTGNDGPCLCDSWVFCGNRDSCGSQFGEVSWNLMIGYVSIGCFIYLFIQGVCLLGLWSFVWDQDYCALFWSGAYCASIGFVCKIFCHCALVWFKNRFGSLQFT